jgi:Leucine-rich repeat (LRR) protein
VILEKLPDSFAKLATLNKLSLKGCENLIELPLEFGTLHSLEVLDLGNCVTLENLPDSFAKLATLKTLWLEGCTDLIELPVEFGSLQALEVLIPQVGNFEEAFVEWV